MFLLALLACTPDPPPLDLAERLEPDEVRAGWVVDDEALFGGISAEGRVGDVKIYNDRVQFVIQGTRRGDYYLSQGGGIVDADVVRPEGQPGRDPVDEWVAMLGLGRVLDAESVVVLDPGFTGRAMVVAEGPASAMKLIEGALEAPGLIDPLGLWMRTEYILRPGSWLLEVRTTITAREEDVRIDPGDVILGAPEVAEAWEPGLGLGRGGDARWTGYMGRGNDVAVALVAPSGQQWGGSSGGDLLAELADLVVGFVDPVEIAEGEEHTFVRYYGVGPDLATISDAVLALDGEATELLAGVVEAPDGPVAGARVNVLVDDAPYTLAVTDAEGHFTARVPAGASTSLLAVGRGERRFVDLPEGAGHWAPYAAAPVLAEVADSLRGGAPAVPLAEGRGIGAPLALGEPARVVVSAGDGLPFEVRAYREGAFDAGDPRLVPGGPGGDAWAIGWARDGDVALLLEPGTYTLLAHRGIRHGRAEVEVGVAAGEEVPVEVSLPKAYDHEGWLLGDPHSHASPSGDGAIPMEERLVVTAAVGVQLHFGTDHDHIADYRPLLPLLGLDAVLGSVVADEVSPVLRGHLNVYPVQPVPGEPNHGAWSWWTEPVPDTEAQMALLRDRHPGAVIQVNHPMESSGLASHAGWSPGRIADPDFWSADFDAVEVLNGGGPDALALYLDLVNRGHLVTPVGVSDSHSHTGGHPGYSATFLGVGTDDPREVTDDVLREALAARRTVVSRGPFLDLSIDPGSVVTGSATLTAEARAPAWIEVDRLLLLEDGVEVERVAGTTATFALAPEADASYVVIAEGDGPLGRMWSARPWAMSSAILVDVAGDGWEPPLGPLVLSE